MQRLDVDYLDFYQVWNINSRPRCEMATMKGGMAGGIKRAMKEGLVRHTDIITHDRPEDVSRCIDEAKIIANDLLGGRPIEQFVSTP